MIKKSLKKKICKSCKGALAIFLCIIFTPFLSIAYSLVEFSRMQSAAETAGEITDMSALSTLSNYDEYLKERFGILALSQDPNFKLTDEYNKYFNENIKMLGGAIDTSKTTSNVSGKLALNSKSKNKHNEDELSVLKSQILDYSESTVALDIMNKDFNIEVLMEKINELLEIDIFGGLIGMFDGLSTIVSSIRSIFDSVASIVETWRDISDIYQEVEIKCNDIVDTIRELSKDIYNEYKGRIINPSDTDKNKIIEEITQNQNYMDRFETVYKDVADLLIEVEKIKDKIGEVIEDVQDSADSIDSDIESTKKKLVKNAEKKNNSNNSNNSNASLSDILSSSPTFLTSVADFSSGLFENLTDKINEKLVERLGENADKIVEAVKSEIKNTFGEYNPNDPNTLKSSVDKLMRNEIIPVIAEVTENGNNTTDDIDDDVWNAKIKAVLFDQALSTLERITSISFLDMVSIVKSAISELIKGFIDSLKAFIDWLIQTISMVKHMFTLTSFYDPELDAVLSDDVLGKLVNNSSEYQKLFESLQSFLSAANKISGVISGKKPVTDTLDALGELLDSAKGIVEAIKTRFENMAGNLSGIMNSIGSGVSGAVNDFYEKLLISGYATHNFPNRSMKEPSEYENLVQKVKLKGQATTGYKYENIKNQETDMNSGNAVVNIVGTLTGIDSVIKIFKSAINEGGGSDETFVGAELEYINAGTASEVVNQIVSFMDIYLLRMVLDIPAYLFDQEAMQLAEEIGAATLGIGTVVYYVVLILVEPMIDTIFLVNGNEVNIIRTKCYLTVNGLVELADEVVDVFSERAGDLKDAIDKTKDEVKKQNNSNSNNNSGSNSNNSTGANNNTNTNTNTKPEANSKIKSWLGDFLNDLLKTSYDTHMLIILMVCRGQSQILANISNMIQLEAASYYKSQGSALTNGAEKASGSEYSLSKAYTTIHAETEVQHNSLLSNFQLNNKSIMKKKYIQDRGY